MKSRQVFAILSLFFYSCDDDATVPPQSSSPKIIISGVACGILPADGCDGRSGFSAPKVVELYVNGTVNFGNISYQVESNGLTPSGIEWSNEALSSFGTVSNGFVYLVTFGQQTFSEMYPRARVAVVNTNFDGNDAIRIVDRATNKVLDQMGNPSDISGSGSDFSASWAYSESFIRRKNGDSPNSGNFSMTQWIPFGNGYFLENNIASCQLFKAELDFGTWK